jgi:hypothetical protein
MIVAAVAVAVAAGLRLAVATVRFLRDRKT